MKIGELAKATGVSIRSLHHYDEIGLLKPTDRSDSGHRIYSKEDISRLQRIVTLREVGLPLEEIGRILGRSPAAVMDTVDRHIEKLENEIETKQQVIQRLQTAKELLKLKDEVNVARIIEAIRSVSLLGGHLSEEELIGLAAHDAALRKKGASDFETLAKDLIRAFRAEMEKGSSPSSPEAQDLMKQWSQLAEMMTGGNEDMKKRLKEVRQSRPLAFDQLAEEVGLTPELWAFIQKAGEVFKATASAHGAP